MILGQIFALPLYPERAYKIHPSLTSSEEGLKRFNILCNDDVLVGRYQYILI